MGEIYDGVQIEVQKLKPKKGELVVVNLPTGHGFETAIQIRDALAQIQNELECFFIILPEGMTLTGMSDEDLERLGLYKRED